MPLQESNVKDFEESTKSENSDNISQNTDTNKNLLRRHIHITYALEIIINIPTAILWNLNSIECEVNCEISNGVDFGKFLILVLRIAWLFSVDDFFLYWGRGC